MQFGKTLIGAIIGAVLGLAVLYAAQVAFHIDSFWLAIPVALLTGIGVRMMASTHGHPSYARGALTVVLALAAYLCGMFAVAAIASRHANLSAKAGVPRAATEDASEPGAKKDAETGDAQAAKAPPVELPKKLVETLHQPALPRQFSPMDAIYLAIAAFVAYELGRGSAASTQNDKIPPEPVPSGTHPDA